MACNKGGDVAAAAAHSAVMAMLHAFFHLSEKVGNGMDQLYHAIFSVSVFEHCISQQDPMGHPKTVVSQA